MLRNITNTCIIKTKYMNLFSKDILQKMFNALVVTFAFAAMCHLLLVGVVALLKRDIRYINPLDFLGISILLPQYRESPLVAAGGWVVLIILFFIVLYIRVHYHVYVTVVTSRMYERIIKFSEKTIALRARARELGKETLLQPISRARRNYQNPNKK